MLDYGTTVTIDEQVYGFLSYGPGFATVLRCYGNMSLGSEPGVEQAVEHFVGQDYPTLLVGEAKDLRVGVSVRVMEDGVDAGRADFEAAAATGGTMLWRDPSGRRVFGMMSGLSTSAQYARHTDLSFTMTRTAHDG